MILFFILAIVAELILVVPMWQNIYDFTMDEFMPPALTTLVFALVDAVWFLFLFIPWATAYFKDFSYYTYY